MSETAKKSISCDDLHDHLLRDPLYGISSGFTPNYIKAFYEEKKDISPCIRFQQQFKIHPLRSYDQFHLIFIWVLFKDLPVFYKNRLKEVNETVFLDEVEALDFFILHDDLKKFLKKNKLSFPGDIFSNEKETTKTKKYSKNRSLHDFAIGTPEHRKAVARNAALALHSKPGGNHDKATKAREEWASGKYKSRDGCAEEICESLGWSFSATRKALRNTPAPKT